ncbi:hypothetical protein [Microbacterium sp. CCH5-D1]|uniref:hypothetical protein n=1 Tax=Microbacterium sp. CCH5-D1 TaxID=1768780 RepID=UPI0012F9EF2D|nr:hypothetical protein [Microbacterium sp. CCH5-D1]
MLSETIMTIGSDRHTSGPVSLAQGVYGTRGNLELVACDTADGLWVFWFNADHPDDPLDTPDVPPGRWSAGLSFASGRRYLDAQIVQSTLGPHHLEVLARNDEGSLESWFWSPGPGFARRDTDAAASVSRFRLTHQDGVLRVDLAREDGTTAVLSSGVDGYPDRTWMPVDEPADVDDALAAALLSRHGISDVVEGTARAADSTRRGGTIELTWRDRSGRIRHLGLPST